jgi:hypothetical protein
MSVLGLAATSAADDCRPNGQDCQHVPRNTTNAVIFGGLGVAGVVGNRMRNRRGRGAGSSAGDRSFVNDIDRRGQ